MTEESPSYESLSQQIVDTLGWSNRLKEPFPKLLWHYTSLDSFHRIVSSQCVRATDLAKMNDYMEGKWLLGQMPPYISAGKLYAQMVRTFDINPPLYPAYRTEPSVFSHQTDGSRFQVGPVFAFSLSRGNDVLSQWRAYASGGRGVAIGFDPSAFGSCDLAVDWSGQNGTILSAVEYSADKQQLIVDLIAPMWEKAEKATEYWAPAGSRRRVNPNLWSRAFMALTLIFRRFGPFFKNPSFVEESEWRLVYLHDLADPRKKTICYRFSADDVIPYVEYPGLQQAVKAIVLGPLCRAEVSTVSSFLSAQKIEASITRSKASLQ